jgi:hypothetical protein
VDVFKAAWSISASDIAVKAEVICATIHRTQYTRRLIVSVLKDVGALFALAVALRCLYYLREAMKHTPLILGLPGLARVHIFEYINIDFTKLTIRRRYRKNSNIVERL